MHVVIRLTVKVWNQIINGWLNTDGGNNSLKSVDGIDFQMDFFGLHLLLEQTEGIYGFDHFISDSSCSR